MTSTRNVSGPRDPEELLSGRREMEHHAMIKCILRFNDPNRVASIAGGAR